MKLERFTEGMEDGYFLINCTEFYGEFYIPKEYYNDYSDKNPYTVRYFVTGFGIQVYPGRIERVFEGDYIIEDEDGRCVIKPGNLASILNKRRAIYSGHRCQEG